MLLTLLFLWYWYCIIYISSYTPICKVFNLFFDILL